MTTLPWPLPALAVWGACWGAFAGLRAAGVPLPAAAGLALALGVGLAVRASTPWRRVFVGAGFPVSLAAAGAVALPAWAWLVPLALLAFVYPLRAWRDAPVFPTPPGALAGLGVGLALPPGAAVLDAGCGFGDALAELRREYPQARLSGLEWSWPLSVAAAWRCRFANVRRGDMWAASWRTFDLVYLFQRPESMGRAAAKAALELRPGAWLASLEFPVQAWRPTRRFDCADGRPLWLYRIGDVAEPRAAPP